MSEVTKNLEKYVNEHLTRRRFAAKTKASYAYWIFRLTDYFGKYLLSDFVIAEISEFMKDLDEKEGLSPSTIKQAASSFHFFFNTIGKQNWEIRRLRKKSVKRISQYVPTQKEIFSIIKAISSEQSQLAVSLIYSLGLNLEDVINLRKVDIDFENDIIHVPVKHRKVTRKAVLSDSIKPKLHAFIRKKKPVKWVFENKRGAQIGVSSIQKAVKSSTKKLGIKDNITVRSLRYAYIKHLEKLGVNLQDILDELGMSHQTSYAFYSKLGQIKKKILISPIDRRINEEIDRNGPLDLYISTSRINELIGLETSDFDLTKLVQLLHEINVSSINQLHLSIAMQVRALMDHIPPMFSCENFQELANNYNGTKSFKKSMQNLQNSLRNVSDAFLHTQIRKAEVLPTVNQIDFKADLDVLLSEIVRINK